MASLFGKNKLRSEAEKINSLIIAGLITGFAGLVMIFYDKFSKN